MGEIKTYNYNFPPYNNDDVFFSDQVEKIKEEAQEIKEATDPTQAAIECMDVIVACETFLRMLPDGYVDAAKQMVYAKIAGRGKWKEDAVEQATEQTPDAEMPQPRPPAFWWSKKTPSPLVK